MTYELAVNVAGRPYRLYPADSDRELRAKFIAMPPVSESQDSLDALCREAGMPEAVALQAQEVLAQVFARGATVGFTRGLAKRNELIAGLVQEYAVHLPLLRQIAQLSESHMRAILRGQGVPAATQAQAPRTAPVRRRRRRK